MAEIPVRQLVNAALVVGIAAQARMEGLAPVGIGFASGLGGFVAWLLYLPMS